MTFEKPFLRTNGIYKHEEGLCGGLGGNGPQAAPDHSGQILVGFLNDWEDGVFCWHHFNDVYRGGVRFDLGDLIYANPDDIISAHLSFHSSPWHIFGLSEGCGAGDQLLVPTDNSWWQDPHSGSADAPRTDDKWSKGYFENYYWSHNDGDPDPLAWLATGPPAADTDYANPALGAAGMDARPLLLAWLLPPDNIAREILGFLGIGPPPGNTGFILHSTDNEGGAEDHSTCLMEYDSFRLDVFFFAHLIFPVGP